MATSKKKKKQNQNTTKKKKTNTTVKKNNTVKKTSTNKKKTVSTQKQTKKVDNKTITESKKKKEPIFNDNANIGKEISIIKDNCKKKLKELKTKFKKLSSSVKVLIIVGIICLLVIILEAIVFMNQRNKLDSSVSYHDSYNGIAVSDNSVVVAGNSDFKYSKDNTFSKNSRGKLAKYNEKGELIFEIKYDRGISTTFNDVIEVSDGYIVVGTGIFSEEEKKNEEKEALIIKYDKDGVLVWERFYHVITNTSFDKVIAVSDGYIAIGQSIYANMELGNHTTGGGIIVKYDKDGTEVWHNNHGGTKSGNFNDLVVVNGDIYVVGKDGADSGNLVKYNSNGEYQWHKNYSYTDSKGLTGIAYVNNSLYVVGSKKIFDKEVSEEDARETSNTDALLLKYDLDGNVIFEKTFGGSSYERYNSILMYHNNFYIVGHICSKDAGLKITNDQEDEMTGLIVRYDINGNILKKEVFGGSNNDNLTDVATDGISFYVVGYSNSKDGNINSGRSNGRDYFGKLIKLNDRFKKIYDE